MGISFLVGLPQIILRVCYTVTPTISTVLRMVRITWILVIGIGLLGVLAVLLRWLAACVILLLLLLLLYAWPLVACFWLLLLLLSYVSVILNGNSTN